MDILNKTSNYDNFVKIDKVMENYNVSEITNTLIKYIKQKHELDNKITYGTMINTIVDVLLKSQYNYSGLILITSLELNELFNTYKLKYPELIKHLVRNGYYVNKHSIRNKLRKVLYNRYDIFMVEN